LTNIATSISGGALAFSPKDHQLAVTTRSWDLPAGALVLDQITGAITFSVEHKRALGPLAWLPDASALALASDTAIELWDTRAGRLLHTLAGHTERIVLLSSLADGRTLVSAGDDGCVKLWDTSALQEASLVHPKTTPTNPCYSRDGTLALTRSNSIVLTNLTTGTECIIRPAHDPEGSVSASALSSDGSMLAGFEFAGRSTGRGKGRVQLKVWDVTTGAERAKFDVRRPGSIIAFWPNGKRLAAAGIEPETVIVWDLQSQIEIGTFVRKGLVNSGEARCLAFSPDGRHLAVASFDSGTIWDLETKQLANAPWLWASQFAFSPDGKTLAVGPRWSVPPDRRPLELWDWMTRQKRLTLGTYRLSSDSLAFSPDGKTLAAGTPEGTIRLWQVANGDELFSLPGPASQLRHPTFTHDGFTVIAALDHALYAWRARKQ
jgi:WD40 repeat protein